MDLREDGCTGDGAAEARRDLLEVVVEAQQHRPVRGSGAYPCHMEELDGRLESEATDVSAAVDLDEVALARLGEGAVPEVGVLSVSGTNRPSPLRRAGKRAAEGG